VNWVVVSGLGAVALAGGLALWMRRRLVLVTVRGSSMEPTLRPGDRVLVHRRALARVRRGQVVVLEPPLPGGAQRTGTASLDDRLWNIKRVVALPGDPVPAGVPNAGHAERVPPQALVVLGDSAWSTDSRQRGFYSASDLLGVVVRRL
jgi:signal peptidase I